MTKPTTVEDHVAYGLARYPTLYGKSRIAVMNQTLVVNGNGLEWRGGVLVDRCGQESREKELPSWDAVISEAKANLSRGKDPEFPLNDEEKRSAAVTLSMLIDEMWKPVGFYSLSLGPYSRIGHLPEDIADDWLTAAAQTLCHILHYRAAPRQAYYSDPNNHYDHVSEADNSYYRAYNHANALVLLNRYSVQFRHRKAWTGVFEDLSWLAPYYKGASFWEIRERRDARLLELSGKCHLFREKDELGRYEAPYTRLTAEEYLDYFEIDPTGFERHLPLIAALHDRDWTKRHEQLKQRLETHKRWTQTKRDIGGGRLVDGELIIKATPEVMEIHREWSFVNLLNQ